MSDGIAALGTLLGKKYIESGSGASSGFTTIAEVTDITGPSLSADTIDLTSHDSATETSGFEEVAVSILRSGEVTFDVNFMPANDTQNTYSGNTAVGSGAAEGLLYDYKNKVSDTYQLTFPDSGSTSWQFDAFVTGYEPSAPHDDKLGASITLKINGQPTLA